MSELLTSLQAAPEPVIRFRDNPIRIAQARRRCRKKELWASLIVFGLLSLCGFLFASMSDGGPQAWGFAGDTLLLMAAAVVLLGGTSNVAGAMADERATGILDFHRATPTTPATDALGYLLGCPAREYAVAALVLPFVLLTVALSDRSLVDVLTTILVFGASGVLYHCLGLLAGFSGEKRRRTASAVGVGILVFVFLAPTAAHLGLTSIAYLSPYPALVSADFLDLADRGLLYRPELFGVPLPPLVYTLIVQGFVFSFLFVACTRKLRSESLPAFSRPGALAFFVIATILLVGGAWSALTHGGRVAGFAIGGPHSTAAITGTYLLGATVVAASILASLTPPWLEFARAFRRAKKRGLTAPGWLEDGAKPWLLVPALGGVVLAGLALIALAASTQASGGSFAGPATILAALAVASLLTLATAAAQFARFTFRKSYKTGVMLIAFLTLILPWIVAALVTTAGNRDVALYVSSLSPLFAGGYSAFLLSAEWSGSAPPLDNPGPILVSIVVTSLLAGFFVVRVEQAAEKLVSEGDP